MERSPHFDEGYHGDSTSQPGSDTGIMTPNSTTNALVESKTAILQLSTEARYRRPFAHLLSISFLLTRV